MLRRALGETLGSLAARTLAPVDVVVIDSGIDSSHAELAGRIVRAHRIEIVEGKPHVVDVPIPSNGDAYGHGTAVASVIAKVAANARIVDVRVLGSDNKGGGEILLAGLELAIRERIPVINMSLAATAKFSAQLAALCETAYRQGQVVIAAKRNQPLFDNGFPAELSSSISVDRARLDSLRKLVYRPQPIEFAAHGEDVVVAAPGGGYTTKTGTSFATPVLSGICALVLGAFPELRPFEVKAILKAYAEEVIIPA